MGNFYKKNFAINSPMMIFLLIGTLVLGIMYRVALPMPTTLGASQVNILTKFGFTNNFIVNNANIFLYVKFGLSIMTILAIYFLGQNMIGKTGGICAAFTFAVYPYFVHNTYRLNMFLIFSFVMYLLFMYIGASTASKVWNFVSGIFFMFACIMEPAILILGLIPYIYFLIKQKHVAVLNSFLFFLIGVIMALGTFTLIASLKGNLANFIPIVDSFEAFGKGIKAFIDAPIKYITDTIWPYIKNNFAYPTVAGNFSYLHYFIVTLSILGILYSFVHENIRILSILLIFILLQAFFMPYDYAIILLVLVLIASFMVDKVIKDVLQI